MIYTAVSSRHTRRLLHWVLLAASLAVARPTLAQDDRIDDPPDRTLGFSAPAAQGISPGQVAAPRGIFTEPRFVSRSIRRAVDRFGESRQAKPKEGFYLEMSNMITGSGWVSLGPGYRYLLADKRSFFDVSAATSWHLYGMVQGRFETSDSADHFTVGSQVMWQDQTQINYFGIGRDSIQDDQSQYRMKSVDAVGYATVRPDEWLAIGGEVGWLHRPEILAAGGTFKPDFPEAQQQFPNDPGIGLPVQPNYLHTEFSVTADTRDYRSHPTRGSVYRAAVTHYSDRDGGTFSFRQYEAEGLHFHRMGSPNWILALHGWIVVSDAGSGHEVPFYLLPSLGGHSTLRGYSNFRFHDRDLAVVNVESRWALFTHVDGAVFFDAGNVAPRAADLNVAKTSIGAGLRLHTERVTWARVDVGHSEEGWHFVFRTSDPLRLSRLTRRVAAIPFVP
jgi:hypothetical protein